MDIQALANEHKDFLRQWEWEAHITLTFRRNQTLERARMQARTFLNRIKKEHPKMRFSAMILPTKGIEQNHVHIPLISDTGYPETFKDIHKMDIERHWTSGTIRISTNDEWDNETITAYLTKKKNMDLNKPDSYDIDFFRPNLLKRFRRRQNGK